MCVCVYFCERTLVHCMQFETLYVTAIRSHRLKKKKKKRKEKEVEEEKEKKVNCLQSAHALAATAYAFALHEKKKLSFNLVRFHSLAGSIVCARVFCSLFFVLFLRACAWPKCAPSIFRNHSFSIKTKLYSTEAVECGAVRGRRSDKSFVFLSFMKFSFYIIIFYLNEDCLFTFRMDASRRHSSRSFFLLFRWQKYASIILPCVFDRIRLYQRTPKINNAICAREKKTELAHIL